MRTVVYAGFLYFLSVFALGFILGTIRTLFVEPLISATWAVLFEVPIMLSFSWHVSRKITRRYKVSAILRDRLILGGVAFGCLMLGEIGISTMLMERTVLEHFANYGMVPVQVGLIGQVLFGFIPAIQR